jgi:pimeloyl-ACP methyl ester carboxylesterase
MAEKPAHGDLSAPVTSDAMATYALLYGAGSSSWYWHLVAPELAEAGHEVVAPDPPCDDDRAGLAEYVEAVVETVGEREEVILVANSLAGFSAPLGCERLRSVFQTGERR